MHDMDSRLEHVAIAVTDLDAAIATYCAVLGIEVSDRETVESEGVEVAFFELGGPRIELLGPTSADSPVGRFLETRGPGIHHIAVAVPELETALARCREAGLETIGQAPRVGAAGRRVAFIHPRSTGGTLIELSEAND